VVEGFVTNLCCLSVPQELHNDQCLNLESNLKQEVLQCLGVSKTLSTPLYLQSDTVMECYIKTVEEHLWQVVTLHQRDWDTQLPIFLLAYTHDTTGLAPASLVFGRELRLPCDPLFRAPPDKERPTIGHVENLVGHLHDVHSYTH
jgi:hypothetical protein